MSLEDRLKFGPYLTIYNKDYVKRKIIKRSPNSKKQEFKDPISEGFRNFLEVEKREDMVPPSEACEDYLEKVKTENPKISERYFQTPIDYVTVKGEQLLNGKSVYQVEYCDIEADIRQKLLGKGKKEYQLPDNWEIPLTTQKYDFRPPLELSELAMKKSLPIKHPNNLVQNEKINTILNVTTGDSEYNAVIGKLGNFIVNEQMHGKIDHPECGCRQHQQTKKEAYSKMDELKDRSIHHTTIKICEDLKNSNQYKNLFEDIQKLVSTPTVRTEDFKNSLLKAMQENGLDAELKNNIYRWVKTKKKDSSPYDSFFRKAQIHWDKRIHKSLNSMSSELGISLARLRGNSEKEEISTKWNELSNFETDIHKYRPVYAPKDFLEVLLSLRGPCKEKSKSDLQKWEFAQLPLKVKNLGELRNMYIEISRGDQILNSNNFVIATQNSTALETERIALGEKILAKNYAPLAQEYLKKGCPKCLRSRIWTLLLGADVKALQITYFETLKRNVLQYDLMIDKLIIKDINLTASNDDQYFVFEDVLYQVMLCFSRDSEILKQLPNQPAFMQVNLKGRPNTTENTLVFPPSGVIPFHGFTMYAAPFCYLFNNSIELYFVFRAFYVRYWHRLHRVCASSQGIVALCLQFEKLLQCYEPNLWNHFKKCRIHPLRVVIKWIMRAFSGHLPPEQLLTLWDMILAYDSLEIVPLLAVAIVIFRKDNLMKVNTLGNVEAVLADLSSIAVVPLLQMALMKDS